MIDAFKAQLLSIRFAVDAALAMVGPDEADEETLVSPGECPHPKEKQLPAPAMGQPDRFFCRACHTLIPSEGGSS